MGLFLVYIIKASLCMTLLYLPYALLLRYEKWHSLNRIMLLGILSLSFVIPLLQSEWFGMAEMPLNEAITVSLNEAFDETASVLIVNDVEERTLWPLFLVGLYITGILLSVLVRGWQFVSLYRFMPNGCVWEERNIKGWTLYCHAHDVSPFSWMNRIVISEADYESDAGRAIMAHETAHVLYRHSYDTLLVLMAETVMWFNPIVWLIEMDLRCIHEYQADDYVLSQGVNSKNYQMYLIKKAVGSRLQSFANGLNQSTLKKRIAMMYKKSNKWAALKYMYVLPVGAIATVAFAHPEFENRVSNPLKSVSDVKVTDLSETVKEKAHDIAHEAVAVSSEAPNGEGVVTVYAYAPKTSADDMVRDSVYRLVEEMPRFPGGEVKMMEFLAKNVQYPKDAVAKGISGKVVVQMIVRSDGTTTGHKVVKWVNPLLDEEALRVARMMPKWTPGKIKGKAVSCLFSFPIQFRLE